MLESLNLDIQNHTTQFGIVIVKLQDKYRESAENTNASPWQKYKAQCGMSVYNSTDSDVSDVFKRAEL